MTLYLTLMSGFSGPGSHIFFTSIKVIKRPPDGAVGYVGEERRHISTIKAPQSIRVINLHHNVSGLAKRHFVLGLRHLGLEFEACELTPLTLHHQLLGHHVDGHRDALGHQRGRAARHQRLDRVIGRVWGHGSPHQLVGSDVGLTWDQRERVDHEPSVKTTRPLGLQNLPEGVEGAVIEWIPLLDLQSGADQGERVHGGPCGHGHEDAQRVELPLVQILPFDDLKVALLLHHCSRWPHTHNHAHTHPCSTWRNDKITTFQIRL